MGNAPRVDGPPRPRQFWIVGIAAALTLAGCGTGETATDIVDATGTPTPAAEVAPFETVRDGTLTVAFIDGTVPKFALGPDGGITGFEGFLMQRLAEKYDLTLEPLATTFSGALLAVQEGQADIALGTYYTEERSAEFYYTAPNLYDLTGVLMLKDEPYEGPDSLIGRKVGTQEGYVYVPYMEEALGEDNVLLYQGISPGLTALTNGQIAAYVAGTGTGVARVKEDPELTIHLFEDGDWGMPAEVIRSPVHNVVNCENPELADAVNVLLAELRESGEWQAQLEPWGLNSDEFLPPIEPPAQNCP